MRQHLSLEVLWNAAIDAAEQAGRAIMDIYAADTIASTVKADCSPLTEADLAAHRCITQHLEGLVPGLPVVSEEGERSPMYHRPQGMFWLIDPLDGTKEFLTRNGEFTVNIALIDDGCPVFGVVYAPVTSQLFSGGKTLGAFKTLNGKKVPIQVSPDSHAPAELRVVASRSHLNDETRTFLGRLGPIIMESIGSSLKFCKIAEGSADLYPRLAPTCEWDTAAAQAVLEGAGGVVVDLSGEPLHYGKSNCLNPAFIAARNQSIIPK